MSIRIAFSVVRIAETQRQRRSLKPDLPIEHLQSQASLRLDGSCHPPRHAQIAIARHLSRPNSPRVPSLGAFRRRPQCLPHCRDGPSSETLHNCYIGPAVSWRPLPDPTADLWTLSVLAKESDRPCPLLTLQSCKLMHCKRLTRL